MRKEIIAAVSENKGIAKDIFEMRLQGEPNLEFVPGQFAHIQVNQSDLLLRRPISVNTYDENTGEFVLLYKVIGSGTIVMSKAEKGDKLSVLMPLGNGFNISDDDQTIFLVGGGIGYTMSGLRNAEGPAPSGGAGMENRTR